jgi:hypothetical protein
VSPAPSAVSRELAGIQKAPPERAVEPPTYSVFSTSRVFRPASCPAMAAAMPVPVPMTNRSVVVPSTAGRGASALSGIAVSSWCSCTVR